MRMALTAKYTDALPVYVTAEVRQRIRATADREEISQAQVVREIIEAGIDKRCGKKETQ